MPTTTRPAGRVLDALEQSARDHGDRTAVASPTGTATYRQTSDHVAAVAADLASRGLGSGDVVALTSGRTECSLAHLLGVWSLGASALLLDPAHPAGRLSALVAEAGATALLGPDPLGPDGPVSAALAPTRTPGHRQPDIGTPGDDLAPVAYLIATSGSTGEPKLVEVGYDNLDAFCGALESLGLPRGGAGIVAVSPAFDGWLWCCLLYLLHGQTMHTLDVAGDDADLAQRVAEIAPTVVCLTPSLLHMVDDLGPRASVVVSAGEACPEPLIARHAPGRRFLNVYGPTETTIAATWSDSARGDDLRTIGRAIPGYRLKVRDTDGHDVADGMPGELWIGGQGVARGYRGRPDLTARRFVRGPGDETTYYRTGDLVRRRPDGLLDYLGREDAQVKVRGFRVELGEIEHAASRLPGVREAAAYSIGNESIGLALVIDPEQGAELDLAQVAPRLRDRLPAAMVPTRVTAVGRLPLTPNGKLDRERLREYAESVMDRSATHPLGPDTRTDGKPAEAGRATTVETVSAVWAELLDRRVDALDLDFFDAGGHSLLAAKLIPALQARTGVRLTMRAFMAAPTIAGMSAAVDRLCEERSA